MDGNGISVILNVYKRPHTLEQQIEAVKNQSVGIKSENIHVWYNKSDKEQFKPKDNKIKTYICDYNTLFWGRFTVPLLTNTKYVALFDDDIYPQKKWFENCLTSIENVDGIYGGSGIKLSGNKYVGHQKIGWNGINNNDIMKVNLVGHAWFLRKEHLKYLWYEDPVDWSNGEDIMLSYLAQKYGNVETYVPPHPVNNRDLWCTDYKYAATVGTDVNSSWKKKNHLSTRNTIVIDCIKNGWKI